MNELKIEFSKESYMYFVTEEKSAGKAFDRWLEACDNAGFNMDNMMVTEVVLRDANGNDIDEMKL